MARSRLSWSDQQVDDAVAALLRTGVHLAAAVVLLGGLVYLARHGGERPHYGVFHGEPSDLRTMGGILGDAASFSGRGIVQLGLVLLIATPVARVALSLLAFGLQRDWTYVLLTAVVLALLLASLGGHVP